MISDVIMPVMNGRQLHERVTAVRPKMKTLFMSGYTEDLIGRHGMLEEDIYFISKPFSEQALSRKVREVLEH